MEYEKLIYINQRGEKIELGVESEFYCNVSRDVTGLSDVKNTIYSTNSMGQHGDTYIGQRIEPREINIDGTINSTKKDRVLELRRKAQRILNPELSAELIYIYKDFVKKIECKVDSAPIFRKKNVFTEFSISILCCSPFWKEETEARKDVALWVSCWEFPFEITEDKMEFGYRELSVMVNVYNEGDVASGMRVDFKAKGTVDNPILLNVDTQEYIKINTKMKAGDVITVDTEYGNKGAALTRNGLKTDFFRCIDVESSFMQLGIGDNIFRYDAEAGESMLEVTIYHNNKYLGV